MPPASQSICLSCRIRSSLTQPLRSFGISHHRKTVPPESPSYVDVPPSYQEDLYIPAGQKGKLPVPREIFPHKRPDKPSRQYIANVTQDRSPQNRADESQVPVLKRHKLRMTEIRKQHLREGLQGLYERKGTMTAQVAKRSSDKQRQRASLIAQTEREDARLTNVSIPQAMLPQKGPVRYANEQAVYERKLQNVQKHDLWGAMATEDRRNALHTLYMNARNFITTEEQLQQTIDKEFPADGKHPDWRHNTLAGKNIWNLGPPPSIAKMLQDDDTGSGTSRGLAGVKNMHALHDKDQSRMRKIAEELSGGKM